MHILSLLGDNKLPDRLHQNERCNLQKGCKRRGLRSYLAMPEAHNFPVIHKRY